MSSRAGLTALDALERSRRITGHFIPVVGSFAEMEVEPEASADADARSDPEARLQPS